MPLPRFAKLPLPEQERLLEVATREFAQHGYEGASLNRVLEAAGVSKGALYYYFADRDDLYATVVKRVLSTVAADIFDAFDPKTPREFWEGIEQMTALAVEAVRAHPTELAAVRSFQRDLRRNLKPAFAEARALISGRFRAMVRKGQRLGVVRTDLPEDLLVELLDGLDAVLDARLFDTVTDEKSVRRFAALAVDLGRRLVEPPRQRLRSQRRKS